MIHTGAHHVHTAVEDATNYIKKVFMAKNDRIIKENMSEMSIHVTHDDDRNICYKIRSADVFVISYVELKDAMNEV